MFSNSFHTQPNTSPLNQSTQIDWVTFLEASPNGIYLVDAETFKIEYANPKALQQLGYSLEELQEMTPLDFDEKLEDKDQLKCLVSPLTQGQVTQINLETTHRRRNGDQLPIELYLQLIHQGNQSKFFSIAVDISQRKKIEQSLNHKTHQLETIANYIPGLIYQCHYFKDGTININYVSDRVEEILETSADQLYSSFSSFIDLIHEDDRANFIETIQQTIPNLYSFFWEGRLILPSNQIIWVQIRSQPKLHSDGTIITNGVLLDITTQKKAELALQENETIFREFAENIDDILWMVDLDMTKLIYVSPAYEKIWGSPPDKLKENPSSFLEQIHPDDQPKVKEAISKPITKKQDIIYRIIRSDGDIRWLRDRAFPIPNEKGETYRIAGIAQDITEKRKDKQQISHYRQLRDVIFNEATDALFLIDPDTLKILDCNKSAVQLLNADSKDDLVDHQSDFLGSKLFAKIQKFYKNQCCGNQEFQLKTLDDQSFWADMAWQTITVTENQYYLIRITDITAQKQFEEELKITNERLEATNQELEQATRLRDEFLANMSHELKTPLNAIIGLSEAFTEGAFSQISQQQKRAIDSIYTSANHLLGLINNILDLAKIQTGKVSLEFSPTSVRSLCETSLTFVRQQAYQKQIELTTHINTSCDALNIDELRIRQVLINLLSNAIKFTPQGGKVTLTVDEDSSCEHIIFSVTDTGIGIPCDQFESIFEPFQQLDSQLNRKYSGTGLGLPLVRHLIELHEGSIQVESKLGQGTTFYVKLPYSEVCWRASNSSKVVSDSIKTISTSPLILLVSGDQAYIDNHRSYLEACGYQIISVTQFYELTSIFDDFTPQLIVIDLEGFNLEAETIIDNIQQHISLQEIPIIACNVTDRLTHLDSLQARGVQRCLTKPVRLRYLRNELQSLLPEEFQQ